MDRWREASESAGVHFRSHNNIPGRIYDWQDRWYRTPVHWAVLNQRTEALQILLDGGSSAFPTKPKCGVSTRATNVLIETPLEMCLRLYGDSDGMGAVISSLLRSADYWRGEVLSQLIPNDSDLLEFLVRQPSTTGEGEWGRIDDHHDDDNCKMRSVATMYAISTEASRYWTNGWMIILGSTRYSFQSTSSWKWW
jgi:hypothetical protein